MGVVGPHAVNRFEIRDRSIGLACEILRGERGLVEQVGALSIVGRHLDRAIVEEKELVPSRLRTQDELDSIERPSSAWQTIQSPYQRLDETRRLGRAFALESDHPSGERLGELRMDGGAAHEHPVVGARDGLRLPALSRDPLGAIPEQEAVGSFDGAVHRGRERAFRILRELHDPKQPAAARLGHARRLRPGIDEKRINPERSGGACLGGEVLEPLDDRGASGPDRKCPPHHLVSREDRGDRAEQGSERDGGLRGSAHLFEQHARHSQDDGLSFALAACIAQRSKRLEAALEVARVDLQATHGFERIPAAGLDICEALVHRDRRVDRPEVLLRLRPVEQHLRGSRFAAGAPGVEPPSIVVPVFGARLRFDERLEGANVLFQPERFDELSIGLGGSVVTRRIGARDLRPGSLERAYSLR